MVLVLVLKLTQIRKLANLFNNPAFLHYYIIKFQIHNNKKKFTIWL